MRPALAQLFAASPVVRRRRVYYLSGFDPRGAAHYHQLYTDEARKQAQLLGVDITVGPRQRSANNAHRWPVDATWDSDQVKTDYCFLAWDDIVRSHWDRNLLSVIVQSVKNYAGFIRCGAFKTLGQVFKGPLYSALYPMLFLLLLGMVGVAVGASLALLAYSASHHGLLSCAAGLLPMLAIGAAGAKWGTSLGVFWLLRTYSYVYGLAVRPSSVFDKRVAQFSHRIIEEQRADPCDEVVLIGHSVGSILAVQVGARIIEKMAPFERQNIKLVTLGQCIPLLSLIPAAQRFRKDLALLATDATLPWHDMTARADSLCFSYANPLSVSGCREVPVDRPYRQTVRPFNMFDAKTYARIKRNKLRLHFQYLMASDRPDDYDYFRLTAGPAYLYPLA